MIPVDSSSMPPKRFFLLKTRLFPLKRLKIPAKASMLREAILLIAALIFAAAVLLLLLSHI